MKDTKNNKNENLEENEELVEGTISEDKDLQLDQDELLQAKDAEIEDITNQLLRLQADFVNFRKRVEKEKESTIAYAVESLICDLLPTIDNFQRAIDSESDKEGGFYLGVEMIYKELLKKLSDNHIKEIDALGKDFDPNFHHAVIMEESDEYEEGKVIEILQTGYTLKDKVIRPSMVKVAK